MDARTYMAHAADMMELAREEIFIAGWWISPEVCGYSMDCSIFSTQMLFLDLHEETSTGGPLLEAR